MEDARPNKLPRVKAPISAQADAGALRASARRARKNREAPYDHSVPSSLRYQGLVLPAGAKKPLLRVEHDHALSPFVLRLAPPAPDALLSAPGSSILLNFLAADSVAVPARETTAADLALASHEVAAQLAEDEADIRATWRLPRLRIRRPAQTGSPLPVPSDPIAAPLDVEMLSPAFRTETILAALDLPEAEDEEESAMVEFAGTEMIVEEEPAPAQPAWQWPTVRLPSVRVPFALPLGWERAMGAFLLLAFVFVLPLHAMTLVGGLQDARTDATAAGNAALSQLTAGANAVAAQDPGGAKASFDRATERFQAAQHSIDELGGTVSLIASSLPRVGGTVRAGTHLLAAGTSLSLAGARLSDGLLAIHESLSSPTARLSILKDYVSSALPFLDEASREIAGVNAADVPAAQRDAFQTLSGRLPTVVGGLKQFLSVSDALGEILGGNGTRTYLVVFQNNNEIRPTGGFMGSFAELTVRDGKIVHLDIPGGGTYDVRGNLKAFVAAPDPLRLLAARWEFQDTNWFPDFPTSARKILSFYGQAGGPTVDGVVAINASYVADLLALVGAIDMPEYGRTITTDNFVAQTQQIVEHEYDKTVNKPKAFIGALAPKLLDRVTGLSGAQFLTLVQQVNDGLEQRDVQVYFADNDLEKIVNRLGWDGGLKQTAGDYLMPVDTNLGGGKTDGVISEAVDVLSNVAADGTVVDTVTVTRTHHGTKGDSFTGVNNVDYLRLYVPKGSQLLTASGFDAPDQALFESPENGWKLDDDVIYDQETYTRDTVSGTDVYQEGGKTVFGNWMQVKPGAQATATFSYRLPFKVSVPPQGGVWHNLKLAAGMPDTTRYTFTLQKQSGIADRATRLRVEWPDALQTLWTSADPATLAFTNARDGFYAALLGPK